VFSGQNYGANRPDRILTGVRQLFMLMAGLLLPAVLMMSAVSHRAIPLIIDGVSPELIALSGRFMLWCALFVPFQCVNVILKNVLQGIGKPEKAIIASVYDLLVRLACAIFGVAQFGFLAICVTNPIGWVLSAISLIVTCRAVFQAVLPAGGRTRAAKRPVILRG